MFAGLLDDPEQINSMLPRYLAITGEQIRDAARATFRADNRVVVTYVPAEPGDDAEPDAAAWAKRLASAGIDPAAPLVVCGDVMDVLPLVPDASIHVSYNDPPYGLSEQNIDNMVRLLVDRYADGPRRGLRGVVKAEPPGEYADIGVYHPRLKGRMSEELCDLPKLVSDQKSRGRVGLLLLRSYILAGNTLHYDSVIAAMEAHTQLVDGLRKLIAIRGH